MSDIFDFIIKLIPFLPDWLTATIVVALLLCALLYGFDKIYNFISSRKNIIKKSKALSKNRDLSNEFDKITDTILIKDKEAQCVLIMNYHNGTESSEGIPYIYLDRIFTKVREEDDMPYRDLWHNLECTEYGTEISKLNLHAQTFFSGLQKHKTEFQKIFKRIKACQCKSAGFYPIKFKNRPLGMIIVLYKDKQEKHSDYYADVLAEAIQSTALLLSNK